MPRTNLALFAVEQESVVGTAETIVAADVLVRLREGYATTPDHDLIDLQEIKDNSSKTAAVVGRKSVSFNVTYVLRGPGDLVTAPTVSDMWEAALLSGAAAKTIAIGAVTSGPYLAGETITGTNSSATGTVLQDTANGAASVPYRPVSGTMQSAETITGGTSGATATTSGTPADGGWSFIPTDWSTGAGQHATCKLFRDDFQWTGRGCLGDLQFDFSNGGPCIVTQNFVGALSSQGDESNLTVTAFPEASVTVPKFLNADIWIDSLQPTGVVDVSINWPTNPTFVEDANSTAGDGVLYSDYNRDLPTVTIEIDQVAASSYNIFSTLQAGTTFSFELTHGAGGSAGAIWTFAAPAAQVRSINLGNRDPQRATFAVELGLTGDNNDELLIWQH